MSNFDHLYKQPDGFGDFDHSADPQNNQITFENQEYEEQHPNDDSYYTGREGTFGYSSKNRGTDFATFKVVFGRTESKHKLNSSPDNKNNSSIMDVRKRKRVNHVFQTYDVIRGEEVKNKAIVTKDNTHAQYEIQPLSPMNTSFKIPEPTSTKSGNTTPTKARVEK